MSENRFGFKAIISVKMIPTKFEDRKGPKAVTGPSLSTVQAAQRGESTQIWSKQGSTIKLILFLKRKDYKSAVSGNLISESNNFRNELIQLTLSSPNRLLLPQESFVRFFRNLLPFWITGLVNNRFCKEFQRFNSLECAT